MKPDSAEIEYYKRCLCPLAGEDHYQQEGQGGNDEKQPLPIFIGRYSQRGFGFGSILSGLAKNILLPAVKFLGKTAAKSLKKRALNTGAELAKDILVEKKGIKKSLKKHGKKIATEVAGDILSSKQQQQGQGRNRKRKQIDDIFTSNKKKPRKVSDIFIE